jgi:mRNA-degrading endonuclease toxin of MazEF toxin-antitoxin module
MPRSPGRGEIWHVDLEPTKGREQRGMRYVFIVSPEAHNRRGMVIALPISQGSTLARGTGYTSTLMGAGTRTQGVMICDQPRTLDFTVRSVKYIERAPEVVVADVLNRMNPLVT